ncbi:hypothetical protein ACSQ67_007084 [Phaseolus vulgaris]
MVAHGYGAIVMGILATELGDGIDPTAIHSTLLTQRKRDTKGGHKGHFNAYSNHQAYYSMEEAQVPVLEGYVDWKNRPAIKGRHGGMFAASFVLAAEVLENLAYLANASNLVLYLSKFMHFSPSTSANIVTEFMGTSFLLAILGGFWPMPLSLLTPSIS